MTPPQVPDTAGCTSKAPTLKCFTDSGAKGVCEQQQVNTPDFSQPGPPTFSMKEHLVCVAAKPKYDAEDLVTFFIVAIVVVGLVSYNLVRKKDLRDYGP